MKRGTATFRAIAMIAVPVLALMLCSIPSSWLTAARAVQSGSGESSTKSNKPTPKKPLLRKPAPKPTPKKSSIPANSNAANSTPAGSNSNTSDPDNSKRQKRKNLSSLRSEETTEGSRVTLTSDAPLNDYEAYQNGNRYFVVIPQSNPPSVSRDLNGRAYTYVEVNRRGNDTVLIFHLRIGYRGRIEQSFNRLAVVFTLKPSSSPSNTATPNANTQSGP